MDDSDNITNTFVDMEFIRSKDIEQENKIKQIWKFLDEQEMLKPFGQSPIDDEGPENILSLISTSSSKSSSQIQTCTAKTKQKTKKDLKSKQNEKSESDQFDDIHKLEKYLREDFKYADNLDYSYDEINAEIEDYQKRLTKCNCKSKECDCQKKK